MSAVRSNPLAPAPAGAPALRAGVVAWSIHRQALLAAHPDLGFDARSRRPVELRIAFDADTHPTAELFDPAASRASPLELLHPRVGFLDADPYTHIHIASPSHTILVATIRLSQRRPRLLYARTSLIAHLQITGGRYPAPSFSHTA